MRPKAIPNIDKYSDSALEIKQLAWPLTKNPKKSPNLTTIPLSPQNP